MNSISPLAFNPAPTHRQTTTAPPAGDAPPADTPTGRPRALDGPKRADILELLSGGFDLENAAKLVRCSVRTIRREMKRDPSFARDVRRSDIFSLQNPLGALQHALHKNWRTAAWLLERLFPERFARRPQTTAFGKRQARQLLNEVLRIVDADVSDPAQRDRLNGRIRATFEYFTHVYCERKRTKAALRQAIEYFEKKDKLHDPLADLEFVMNPPHLNGKGVGLMNPPPLNGEELELMNSPPLDGEGLGEGCPEPSPASPAVPKRPAPRSAQPQTINEAFQDLIDDLKAFKKASRSKDAQSDTKTNKVLSPTMTTSAFVEDKMDKTTSPQCAEIPANS